MLRSVSLSLLLVACAAPRTAPLALPAALEVPDQVDLDGSFTFRMCVRMDAAPSDLPRLAGTKDWEGGEVQDYTTNNAYGLGRASGAEPGFAISVLPDGAWTWNIGDGRRRLDHRPDATVEGVADGRWHEVGFAVDRPAGVAHLYHDGRCVAWMDLRGVEGLGGGGPAVDLGGASGAVEIAAARLEPGVLTREALAEQFVARFGSGRRPAPPRVWDGRPLKVLAWNIWHGGRRKGRDAGVERVVDVIREADADLVLMQETYGSGPRIAGRLGFDFFLRSTNLSVLSRYPIVEAHRLASGFRFGGATVALRPDLPIQAYSLWINHLPDVSELIGDGASGAELAAADDLTRGAEIGVILDALLPHLERTPEVPVLVGGDFNSGSHLDWTDRARHLEHHHERVVAWPVSVAMAEAGFQDGYRVAHPDEAADPGRTWSPEFSESLQDRIDYVYARGAGWRVLDAKVLDVHPDGWPSDHAAVLVTLALDVD